MATLMFSLFRLRRTDYSVLANYMADRSRDTLHVMRPCPLCGTLLNRGERVHTVVFSGPSEGSEKERSRRDQPVDSLVHMFGCPYCRPSPGITLAESSPSRVDRICPVCRKTLPADGYVIARMFVRGTRKHVHVLGCTECRRKSEGTGR